MKIKNPGLRLQCTCGLQSGTGASNISVPQGALMALHTCKEKCQYTLWTVRKNASRTKPSYLLPDVKHVEDMYLPTYLQLQISNFETLCPRRKRGEDSELNCCSVSRSVCERKSSSLRPPSSPVNGNNNNYYCVYCRRSPWEHNKQYTGNCFIHNVTQASGINMQATSVPLWKWFQASPHFSSEREERTCVELSTGFQESFLERRTQEPLGQHLETQTKELSSGNQEPPRDRGIQQWLVNSTHSLGFSMWLDRAKHWLQPNERQQTFSKWFSTKENEQIPKNLGLDLIKILRTEPDGPSLIQGPTW